LKTIVTQQKMQLQIPQHGSGSGLTVLRARASSVARVLLASVFLLSGISKLHSPASASAFVADVLPTSVHAARMIVIPLSLAEIGAGFLLLFNRWVMTLALLSSLFFLSALTLGLLSLGEEKACGCFGDLLPSQTDEWFVLRSLAFLFLSLFVLRSNVPQSITGGPSKW